MEMNIFMIFALFNQINKRKAKDITTARMLKSL